MSFKLATNWWIVTKKQLEDLTLKDAVWREEALPITDRNYANFVLGEWYVNYCLLYQQLDACYDQLVQPQKRVTIKKLVDAAALRLLEFKESLRNLDFSEYHYIDGTLVELKLIPHDIEILHPTLFCHRPVKIEEMWRMIKKGEKIYRTPEEMEEFLLAQKEAEKRRRRNPHMVDEETLRAENLEKERLGKITACILLIQTAERGRQERIFFKMKRDIVENKKKAKALALAKAMGHLQHVAVQTEEEKIMMENAAAIIIQTYWRGYRVRQTTKYNEVNRRILIGMYESTWRDKKESVILEEALEKRRDYVDLRLKEYVESIDKEEARILRVLRPNLLEDIGDEIREWFHSWYSNCKMFDPFPAEVLGGTVMVVRGETVTPQEYITKIAEEKEMGKKAVKERNKQLKQEAKLAKNIEKQALKKEKDLAKKAAQKRKAEIKKLLPHEYKYYHDPPLALDLYNEGLEEHKVLWDVRDEFKNPQEKHYMELITEEHCYNTQIECRKIVDEMMRLELNLLQMARAKDAKSKYKKPKEPKAKKEKKGKKGKDITQDRKTEDLFQELVNNGIIRTYPKVSLEEFHGDFSYNSYENRQKDKDPPASLLDVRQAVVMHCIIPMGVDVMKRPKSVLITGPRQSGKHILANAIFNATKCVLFDLSPERTAGKYDGKDIKMLLHLICKMSKLLAPSILFFDGAEKIFYKRVPKEEKKFSPKRLGAIFKQIIKDIQPEDRVMVLGITGKPFEASGQLKKLYEKHILIPVPDYNSVFIYWNEILMACPSVERDINITALTQFTVNYPFSVLRNILKEILTVRRTLELKNKPLTTLEIYNYILAHEIEPITEKEWDKYLKWCKGLPYPKGRAKYLKSLQDAKDGKKQK